MNPYNSSTDSRIGGYTVIRGCLGDLDSVMLLVTAAITVFAQLNRRRQDRSRRKLSQIDRKNITDYRAIHNAVAEDVCAIILLQREIQIWVLMLTGGTLP